MTAAFFGPGAGLVPLSLRHREWRDDLVLGDTFGVHLVLDLTRCDPRATGSEERVAEWNTRLCKAIDMSMYGDPFVKTFGFGNPKTPGVTLLQPIETSNLAFHEIRKLDGTAGACIDAFSCKLFDPQVATNVSIAAFGGRVAAMSLLVRGEASPLRPTPGWF